MTKLPDGLEAREKLEFDQMRAAQHGIEQAKAGVATDSAYIRGARWGHNKAVEHYESLLTEAEAALERISDIGSAYAECGPDRLTSYGDWELRNIARTALAKIRKARE